MATPCSWFGIDVSKAHLDVARASTQGSVRIANTPAGWKRLVAEIGRTEQPRVVLEATGPYHRDLVLVLHAHAIPTAVINPAHMRYFARSQGIRAKTDLIDAHLIARYGAQTTPAPTPLPSASERRLAELVSRRQDITQDRVREQNRRGTTTDPLILASIDRHLVMLAGERTVVDRAIAAVTAADSGTATRSAQLRSVPGIGPLIAATLVAGLPELGTASSKQLAALVGVAPFARESGTQHRPRTIAGGRAPVRRALYQAVVSAARSNAVINAHLQRLIARGKPYKVAMVATMRRYLGILNAMLRDGLTWQQTDVGQGRFQTA
jgi:transposase